MKITNILVLIFLTGLTQALSAAEDDSKARDQFQNILDGINSGSYEMVEFAIDKADLSNRVTSARPLDATVSQMFSQSFDGIVAASFLASTHNPTSDDTAELIRFEFEDGKGQAVVRDQIPGYRYSYLVIDLRHDRRGRLKIVDWFESKSGQNFTDRVGDIAITLMPTKASTRQLLTLQDPTDLQLFQATEILKASRDTSPARFFEIYANFDEELKKQPLIARLTMARAAMGQDAQQFVDALTIFDDTFSETREYSAARSDYFLQIHAYQESQNALQRFHEFFGVKEGGVPARLSALALVTGNTEDAEKFALEATTNEPGFELGWWSLLRARAAVKDFEGCLEGLTTLEDSFEHRMDAAKLRRDPFRAFNELASSDEFKDWRAAR